MKKVELLSPVGNKEMLYQAIHNGADAVYLSGKKFGARKFANNFTDEELIEAIKYSHLYNVKVYVTVNTMIYESELEEIFNYLKFLYLNNADAVIMQDIGIIQKTRQLLPNLEIHASTQCHNHNEQGIKLLKNLGIKRVVLAREMSLEEINSLNTNIEKEVFVYGALCVCYSGCCLFSSLNGGRSGNRGECVGSCRLPYKLLENDKIINTEGQYLLSCKDLNTLPRLKEILDSNIDCLKIEGRMKSPYYVGYVTKVYRRLIDNYYQNKDMTITEEETTNLKKLFNREFTSGYLFNDKNITNIKSPNHLGIRLGKVIKVDNKKIYIKLDNDDLNQEDGIRFKNSDKGMIVNLLYNDKQLLTNHIPKGNIACLDNKFNYPIYPNDIVLKTIDHKLISSQKFIEEKKINISYKVKALLHNPIEISISDGKNTITKTGNIITKSQNRPTTKEDIKQKLNKLGNTPYQVNNIDFKIDENIFIPLTELNNLRRNLIESLTKLREGLPKEENIIFNLSQNIILKKKSSNYKINSLVRTEEQLLCCLDNKIDSIYITDYSLYTKYKNKYSNLFYRPNRINNCKQNFNQEKLLIGELGGISKYSKNNEVVSDYYLNISNNYSIDYLNSLNVKRITLSVELNDTEISHIMKKCPFEVELLIYGRVELMIMKYCPLKQLLNHCKLCKDSKNTYSLLNKENKKYPIIHNNCYTSIMHYENIDKISNISFYQNLGINNYRIELFDEDYNTTQKIIDNVKSRHKE